MSYDAGHWPNQQQQFGAQCLKGTLIVVFNQTMLRLPAEPQPPPPGQYYNSDFSVSFIVVTNKAHEYCGITKLTKTQPYPNPVLFFLSSRH